MQCDNSLGGFRIVRSFGALSVFFFLFYIYYFTQNNILGVFSVVFFVCW